MDQETLNNIMNFGLPLLLIVGFFLIMIIPQRKRDKKTKDMLSNIRKGDRIRTIGGIFGDVTKVSEDTVVIELVPGNTKMMIVKTAIHSVVNKNEDLEPELDEETK